jgi:hypothetical protein
MAVVVPAINPAAYLRRQGAIVQRWADHCQLILVADGSADLLPPVLPDGWFGVATGRRLGSGAARNVGAAVATADVVLFLDDDMEPEPGALAAHAAFHQGAPKRVGLTRGKTTALFGGSFFDVVLKEWLDDWLDSLDRCCHYFDALCSANFSVDRELFAALGGFDERFREWGRCDTELGYRLLEAGASFGMVEGAAAIESYDKSPSELLSNFAQMGAADVELCSVWPELRDELFLGRIHHAPPNLRRWREALDDNPRWVDGAAAHLDRAAASGLSELELASLFWLLADHAYRKGAGHPQSAPMTLVLDATSVITAGGGPELGRSIRTLRRELTAGAIARSGVSDVAMTCDLCRYADVAAVLDWADPGRPTTVFVDAELLDADGGAIAESLRAAAHEVGILYRPSSGWNGAATDEVVEQVAARIARVSAADGLVAPHAFTERRVQGAARFALRRAGVERAYVPGGSPADLGHPSLNRHRVRVDRATFSSISDLIATSDEVVLGEPCAVDVPFTRPFPLRHEARCHFGDIGWRRSCFAGPTLEGCFARG